MAESVGFGCQVVIIRRHRAALEGMEELGCVEAEDLGDTEATDHPSPMRTLKGRGTARRHRRPDH